MKVILFVSLTDTQQIFLPGLPDIRKGCESPIYHYLSRHWNLSASISRTIERTTVLNVLLGILLNVLNSF